MHDLRILEAYSNIEPWGDARDDLRHGSMTSVLLAGIAKRDIDPFALADYLPAPKPELKPRGKRKQQEQAQFTSPEAAAMMFRNQYMQEGR